MPKQTKSNTKKVENTKKEENINKQKEDKSFRTMFIRVMLENDTKKDGLVIYTMKDIEEKIEDLKKACSSIKYAYVLHDRDVNDDGEAVKPHVHIVGVCGKNANIKWSRLVKIFPYSQIKSCESVPNATKYLIHKNDKKKFQYDKKEIITNYSEAELDTLLVSENLDSTEFDESLEVERILEGIRTGLIREFDLTKHVSINIYARYRTMINNAFYYRALELSLDATRNIKVVFINGGSGSGKSTLARYLIASGNYNGVVYSSSDNDAWQDYKGQDVIVLDDYRDSSIKYNDLLKMIDPHHRSSTKSRFNNKMFTGKLIIITSVVPLSEWYKNKATKVNEDMWQLYRRITDMITVNEKTISIYKGVSREGYAGAFVDEIENPVYKEFIASGKEKDALPASLSNDWLVNSIKTGANSLGISVESVDTSKDLPF